MIAVISVYRDVDDKENGNLAKQFEMLKHINPITDNTSR